MSCSFSSNTINSQDTNKASITQTSAQQENSSIWRDGASIQNNSDQNSNQFSLLNQQNTNSNSNSISSTQHSMLTSGGQKNKPHDDLLVENNINLIHGFDILSGKEGGGGLEEFDFSLETSSLANGILDQNFDEQRYEMVNQDQAKVDTLITSKSKESEALRTSTIPENTSKLADSVDKTANSTLLVPASQPLLRKQSSSTSSSNPATSTKPKYLTPEEEELTLARSIFIKNVDYKTTKNDLEDHFKECGQITRCTIATDKHSGQPLGHAYIEFATLEGAQRSKLLNESLFKGRQITVQPKRKNKPGFGRGNGGFGGGSKYLMSNQNNLLQQVTAITSSLIMGSMMAGGPAGMMGRGRGAMGSSRGGNFGGFGMFGNQRGGRGGRGRPY
eukprot:403363390